jgi:chromatin segregation and condensation protein Rec8/ScpA/Scc1 (kleisin family)
MQTLRAQLPPAQINSVEQSMVEIVQEESGWWNKISTEDRQNALNKLLGEAKQSKSYSTLLADADKAFREQFEEIIRKSTASETTLAFESLP